MSRLRVFDTVVLGALALVLVLVATAALAQHRPPDRPGAEPPAQHDDPVEGGRPLGVGPEPAAVATLHAWDAARAEAYARDSPRRLRDLYVAGAAAGSTDLSLLRGYHVRGLRVVGLRVQVLALRVRRSTTGRLELRVTDRLAAATAVHGADRRPLPHTRARTRDLTLLRQGDGRWRLAEARAVS